MKLNLKRVDCTDKSSIGILTCEDEFLCYTLEDAMRDVKIQDKTAIPLGTYKIIVDYSPRFDKLMPHLLDVPNFTGIRMHIGNYPEDTDGCILVGYVKGRDFIGQSRVAFDNILSLINIALKKGEEIIITISKE